MNFIIIGVALIFFLGHFLNWFFEKTKVPDLLVLIAIGIILGPLMGYIQAEDFGKIGPILSTFALVFILYESGLQLNTKALLSSSGSSLKLSLLTFLLSSTVATLVIYLLALQPFFLSLLGGIALGSTSSAVVLPIVKKLSLDEHTKTVVSLESVFTDILSIVIFLVLLDGLLSKNIEWKNFLIGVGPKTLMAIVFGFLFGVLWLVIRKSYENTLPKMFSGEAWALFTYGLTELSGYNGAIMVLVLGFTLTNARGFLPSLQAHTKDISLSELSILREITFLLKIVFFIYLGILIQIESWYFFAFALLITALIFITRYISVHLLFKPENCSRFQAMSVVSLGPRGLACSVLALLPAQKGLAGGDWIQGLLFSVIPLTIFFSSVLIYLSEQPWFREKMGMLFKKYS